MTNKYHRKIYGITSEEAVVDVYSVLRAFDVTDPALQHSIKKLLCAGIRGHKDQFTDLMEAHQSLERSIHMFEMENNCSDGRKIPDFYETLGPLRSYERPPASTAV